MVRDDPSFLLDFAFDPASLDLDIDLPTDLSTSSDSILSPQTVRSSQTSASHGSLPGIELPSSASGLSVGLGGLGDIDSMMDVEAQLSEAARGRVNVRKAKTKSF